MDLTRSHRIAGAEMRPPNLRCIVTAGNMLAEV